MWKYLHVVLTVLTVPSIKVFNEASVAIRLEHKATGQNPNDSDSDDLDSSHPTPLPYPRVESNPQKGHGLGVLSHSIPNSTLHSSSAKTERPVSPHNYMISEVLAFINSVNKWVDTKITSLKNDRFELCNL